MSLFPKPASPVACPDPRHQALMAEIDFIYRWYNDGLPSPDMGRVAKALSEFLRANPRWPLKAIQRAIRNRFYSDGQNPSASPWVWIRGVLDFYKEPLGKFHEPMHGKGDWLFEWWEKEKEKVSGDRCRVSGNSEL